MSASPSALLPAATDTPHVPAARWQWSVVLLISVTLVTFFVGLGVPALWDQDEGYFAATALEMHRRGDWIVPTFNGELFGHKPPFMFWMMRLGFFLWGENELGARFFSACFGTLTAIVTFFIGRQLFSASQRTATSTSNLQSHMHDPAVWAGLIMASCLMFGVVARAATPDSFLVCWISVALLAYVYSVPEVWRDATGHLSLGQLLPSTWFGWLGIYGAMGVAVLVKGPIGILLPGVTVGLFVILVLRSQHSTATGGMRAWNWLSGLFTALPWRVLWSMHPFLALAVVLLIAGPWFVLVGWKTNGQFLIEFFGTHNVGRFLTPMENHRGPIWYYIPVTLAGFFPWSIFALPVAINLYKQLFGQTQVSRSRLFLACWLLVMIGFFSIASTKLPSYVLPAYPALALLTAAWVVDWLQHKANIWNGWPAIGWSIFAAVGAVILLVVPLLGVQFSGETLARTVNLNEDVLRETLPLMSVGLVPLLFGSAALWLLWKQRRLAALNTFATGSIAFCLALLAGAAIQIDRHQYTDDMVAAAANWNSTQPKVATYGYFQPSMVFYSPTPVTRLAETKAAELYLQQPGNTLLLTTSGRTALETESSLSLEVVAERPNFPKPGMLQLVRARQPQPTAVKPRPKANVVPASYEFP